MPTRAKGPHTHRRPSTYTTRQGKGLHFLAEETRGRGEVVESHREETVSGETEGQRHKTRILIIPRPATAQIVRQPARTRVGQDRRNSPRRRSSTIITSVAVFDVDAGTETRGPAPNARARRRGARVRRPQGARPTKDATPTRYSEQKNQSIEGPLGDELATKQTRRGRRSDTKDTSRHPVQTKLDTPPCRLERANHQERADYVS